MRCFGVAGGCARLDVVIDAEGLDALLELLLLHGSISLCLDLCFALAVGGFGLLEDADEVLALKAVSSRLIAYGMVIGDSRCSPPCPTY